VAFAHYRFEGVLPQSTGYKSLSLVNVTTKSDHFKVSELSQSKEFYLTLRWYLAGLTDEANFPTHQGPIANDEFTESV
jgi:hypothetical protein